jgi:hypothetical protein
MKDATCDTLCVGSKYFAIQYGRDCYCFEDAPTKNNDQSACTYPNSGDVTQIGGSDTAYSVFTTAGFVPGTTLVDKFIGFFSSITDGTTPEPLLDGLPGVSVTLTQKSCKDSCSAYKYFALTKGNTCICGNSYSSDDAVELTSSDTVCKLKIPGGIEAGGGADCIALFENLDYKVRPGLLTLCSNLCSANMKTYTPRLVWLLQLRFGPALVAIRGRYAAKPALRPRHYSRQEPEVRVGYGLLDLDIDHDAIDTTSPRSG